MTAITRQAKGQFQTKLLTLLTLGILIPLGLSSSYNLVRSTEILSTAIEDQMQLEGEESTKNINTILGSVNNDVIYLSKTPPVQGIIRARENEGVDPLDNSSYASWVQRLETILASFMESQIYYDQIRYLDETGQELVRVNNINGSVQVVPQQELQNKASSDYVSATLALGQDQVYVSAAGLNRENGKIEQPYKPIIRYATPVYSAQGAKRGLIIINVLADTLFNQALNRNIMNELEQRFMVVNTDGYYLFHPDDAKTWGFELNRDERLQNDFPEVSDIILEQSQGFLGQGRDSLMSYHRILPSNLDDASSFILVYETPKSVVFAPIRGMRNVAIVIILGSLAIVLPLGIMMLRQLVRSLVQFMGTVSTFSTQLLTTIDEQERMASQQSSSVHETTTTMDQLRSSSHQSAQQAEAAAAGAQQALRQVGVGQEQVQHTLTEMDNLKERVGAIATQVQHLNEQAAQINAVSSLVSDLANQTNMLALNAAVEAVRAGENGKGFAVVAAEIRKLADESQKSGDKIGELVSDVQKAIIATVSVTDQGRRNVEQGVTAAQQGASHFR